jgi:hypothetical protein
MAGKGIIPKKSPFAPTGIWTMDLGTACRTPTWNFICELDRLRLGSIIDRALDLFRIREVRIVDECSDLNWQTIVFNTG